MKVTPRNTKQEKGIPVYPYPRINQNQPLETPLRLNKRPKTTNVSPNNTFTQLRKKRKEDNTKLQRYGSGSQSRIVNSH